MVCYLSNWENSVFRSMYNLYIYICLYKYIYIILYNIIIYICIYIYIICIYIYILYVYIYYIYRYIYINVQLLGLLYGMRCFETHPNRRKIVFHGILWHGIFPSVTLNMRQLLSSVSMLHNNVKRIYLKTVIS